MPNKQHRQCCVNCGNIVELEDSYYSSFCCFQCYEHFYKNVIHRPYSMNMVELKNRI